MDDAGSRFGEPTDDLYREVILDHFTSPRHAGRLENPDISAQGVNPLCGDEVEITATCEGDRLSDIRFSGKGCAISRASASMMAEILRGRSFPAARDLAGRFKKMLLEGAPPPGEGDLDALEGVKNYPVRIKCALLAWNTLLLGLEEFSRKRAPVTASHQES